jgi:hypothetical protein
VWAECRGVVMVQQTVYIATMNADGINLNLEAAKKIFLKILDVSVFS